MIVMQIRFTVEVLAWESQVETETRQFLSLGIPKRFALPTPDNILVLICRQAASHKVIVIKVQYLLRALGGVDLSNGIHALLPDIILN